MTTTTANKALVTGFITALFSEGDPGDGLFRLG